MKLSTYHSFLLAATLSLLLAGSSHASADIIVITGGDPGEGYAPFSSNIFAAVNTGSSNSYTLQGVTFTSTDPHISITSTDAINSGSSYLYFGNSTADDLALSNIGGTDIYNVGTGAITLTISGLTVGTTYQLDSFSGLNTNYVARNMVVSALGATTVTDATPGDYIGDGHLYDFRQILQPNSFGVITVTYTAPDLGDATLNGFSIAATPEPSATALLGLGLLLVGWLSRIRPFTHR